MWKDWDAGAKPTEAEVQDWQDQGLNRVASTTRPPAAKCTDGMHIFETDTRRYQRWDGPPISGAWVIVDEPAQSFTADFLGLPDPTSQASLFRRRNGVLSLRVSATWAGGVVATSAVSLVSPFAVAARPVQSSGLLRHGASAIYRPIALVLAATSTSLSLYGHTGATATDIFASPTTGDTVHAIDLALELDLL